MERGALDSRGGSPVICYCTRVIKQRAGPRAPTHYSKWKSSVPLQQTTVLSPRGCPWPTIDRRQRVEDLDLKAVITFLRVPNDLFERVRRRVSSLVVHLCLMGCMVYAPIRRTPAGFGRSSADGKEIDRLVSCDAYRRQKLRSAKRKRGKRSNA